MPVERVFCLKIKSVGRPSHCGGGSRSFYFGKLIMSSHILVSKTHKYDHDFAIFTANNQPKLNHFNLYLLGPGNQILCTV